MLKELGKEGKGIDDRVRGVRSVAVDARDAWFAGARRRLQPHSQFSMEADRSVHGKHSRWTQIKRTARNRLQGEMDDVNSEE